MRFVHARERLPNPLPSALSHTGVVIPGFCARLVIFCTSTVSVESFLGADIGLSFQLSSLYVFLPILVTMGVY